MQISRSTAGLIRTVFVTSAVSASVIDIYRWLQMESDLGLHLRRELLFSHAVAIVLLLASSLGMFFVQPRLAVAGLVMCPVLFLLYPMITE